MAQRAIPGQLKLSDKATHGVTWHPTTEFTDVMRINERKMQHIYLHGCTVHPQLHLLKDPTDLPKLWVDTNTLYCVQLLLSNDREIGEQTTVLFNPISRQRIGKHVPVATNTHATIELFLEMMFYNRSVWSGDKEEKWGDSLFDRVEFCTGILWR
jgi:hypothetical protein